jgi:MFS transporter, MHS family, proline/betaine transporter
MSQALHNTRSEPATGATASGRALVAACAGNLVEWYDFAVYGAFATIIAATFFPGSDPSARLLASFAVFATAFLVRPVGALLFGRLGDRAGRRRVLATVIVLMALATAGIGLLPGYTTIGMLAPLLLTLLRSAQGLSVGGESSGATAFVVEYAPEGRRGWYGAWLWSTLALGVAGGIGVAVLLARVLPGPALRGGAGAWPSWSRCPSDSSGCTCGCGWTRRRGSGPPSGRGPSSGGRWPRRSAATGVAC